MKKKRTPDVRLLALINYWLPPVIWVLVIFLFSSYPTVETSQIHWKDFFIKKTAHVVEFGILALLFYRALLGSNIGKRRAGFWAIYISIFFGVFDEVHQIFTPGREPTVRDVLFDTIGASFSIYLLWKWLAKAPKRLRNWAEKLQIS